MSSELRPTVVEGEDWLRRIAQLRVLVWRAEGMLAADWYRDGYCLEELDREAVHVVVCDGDDLAGAVRYSCYATLAECPYESDLAAKAELIPEPFAIPERLVVHPDYQKRGIWRVLGASTRALCYRFKARALVSEAAPRVAESMRRRGRLSLGIASPDPRFPGIQYEWMLAPVDLEKRPAGLPVL